MPSGLRQTPLGARKPVARISVCAPSLLTRSSVPCCGTDGRHAVPRRLGVVEVPLGVGLQAHRELVEVLGDLVVAVEVLVEVGLAVAVEVAEVGRSGRGSRRRSARRRSSGRAAGTARRRSAARSARGEVVDPVDAARRRRPRCRRRRSGRRRGSRSRRAASGRARDCSRGASAHRRRTGRRRGRRTAGASRTSGHRCGPPRVSGSSGSGAASRGVRSPVPRAVAVGHQQP